MNMWISEHVDFRTYDPQFMELCRPLQDVTSVTAPQHTSRVWS